MHSSSLRREGERPLQLPVLTDLNEDHAGQTALHFTASKNTLETARKLISHKASARVKDRRGQLPLHRAAAVGSVPMVKLLLDNKSPLNATDISGYTALHHAISEGHGDTALTLLKAGAETDKKDVDGFTAIELAPDTKVKPQIDVGTDEMSLTVGHRYGNSLYKALSAKASILSELSCTSTRHTPTSKPEAT